MRDADDRPRYEGPHQRAARLGREAAAAGGGWRDCPYTPGTREFFEWVDGHEAVSGRNPYAADDRD